jgi:hypothetical protein
VHRQHPAPPGDNVRTQLPREQDNKYSEEASREDAGGRLGVTVPQRQMGVGALGAGAVRSRAGVCENWQPSLLHPRPHAGGLLQVEGRHGTGDRWADLEESWGHTAVIDIAEMGKIQNLSFLGSQGS